MAIDACGSLHMKKFFSCALEMVLQTGFQGIFLSLGLIFGSVYAIHMIIFTC